MEKRLYKSTTDRKIFGVCGGIGEYFNIDATIVRLILVFLVLAGGSGILAYIIASLIMSDDPGTAGESDSEEDSEEDSGGNNW